jgi:hypothetical protein
MFITPQSIDFGAEQAVVLEGVLYAPLDPTEEPFEITTLSRLDGGGVCQDIVDMFDGLPAVLIIDLDAEFTPPFRLDF